MPTATNSELTEHQRGQVQLSQLGELTMEVHVRDKLRMGRERLAKAWGVQPKNVADDMAILARDIHFPEEKPTPSKLPLAAALILGLGAPATAGVIMAPTIINALQPGAVVEQPAPQAAEYIPILLPGKPE